MDTSSLYPFDAIDGKDSSHPGNDTGLSTDTQFDNQGFLDEELSVDLQQLIDSVQGAPVTASQELFPELTTTNISPASPSNYRGEHLKEDETQMPSEPSYTFHISEDGQYILKPEPVSPSETATAGDEVFHYDEPEENTIDNSYASATLLGDSSVLTSSASTSNGKRNPLKATPPSKSKRRAPQKDSVEYRAKRDRNNVAVRKSRDKAKQRQKETEEKVHELTSENEALQKKVDLLSKELNVLKGLFANVGASLPSEVRSYLKSEKE